MSTSEWGDWIAEVNEDRDALAPSELESLEEV